MTSVIIFHIQNYFRYTFFLYSTKNESDYINRYVNNIRYETLKKFIHNLMRYIFHDIRTLFIIKMPENVKMMKKKMFTQKALRINLRSFKDQRVSFRSSMLKASTFLIFQYFFAKQVLQNVKKCFGWRKIDYYTSCLSVKNVRHITSSVNFSPNKFFHEIDCFVFYSSECLFMFNSLNCLSINFNIF